MMLQQPWEEQGPEGRWGWRLHPRAGDDAPGPGWSHLCRGAQLVPQRLFFPAVWVLQANMSVRRQMAERPPPLCLPSDGARV